MNSHWKKFIPACVGGNILELYDFIIYGYFASTIGYLFFPILDSYMSLMAAFGVFATGSFVRPFSSMIFGHIGDKLGRRISLIISIGIMSVSTLGIGLLPTYSQVGWIAPMLLVICKVGQGLSMVGEEVGAALFLMENAPREQKAYAGSLVLGSVYLGLLLGSIITVIIFSIIPDKALLSWGWRIPFIVGGIWGIITLLIRIKQPESLEFKNASLDNKLLDSPLVKLFATDLFSVIKVTMLFCLMAVAIYLFAVFIPNRLNPHLSLNRITVMLICSFGFITAFFASLHAGKLTDKIGYFIPLFASSIGFLIFSYPIFLLLTMDSIIGMLISYLFFAVLLGFTAGAIMLPAIKSFPINVRFSGCCIAFNLSMSVFGGIAPILALYLTKITHSSSSPALLLVLAAVISLITLLFDYSNKSIQEENSCLVEPL